MPLREWLFTNMTIRNMLADFGFRKERKKSKSFTTYFQYKIGDYQIGDFFLYFPEQPFWEQYLNEAFNKLREINALSVKKYFQFHYDLFADNKDFLAFARYEIDQRLRKAQKEMKTKLKQGLEWIQEKEKNLSGDVQASDKNSLPDQILACLLIKRKMAGRM